MHERIWESNQCIYTFDLTTTKSLHSFFVHITFSHNNLCLLKFYLLSTAVQPDVPQDGALDIDIDIEEGNQEGVETELASASSPGAPSVDGSYSEKSSEDGSYSVESDAQRRAFYSLSLPTFNLVKFFQATLALGAVLASALVVTIVVQRWNNAAATASLAASFAKAPKQSKAPKSKSSKAPSSQPSVSNYPSFSPSTSSAPTTCTKKQDGVECGMGSECCSPVCDQACQGLSGGLLAFCLSERPKTCGKCVDNGNVCSDSEQCCGSDHFCSLGLTCTDQCTTRGNLCTNDDQCCGGKTCDKPSGFLLEFCDGCIANGITCTSASQCCETTTCKKSSALSLTRKCGSCIPQDKSCLLNANECCDGLTCQGFGIAKKCKP